jgi:outer membrane receptor protein involved in Fe transport
MRKLFLFFFVLSFLFFCSTIRAQGLEDFLEKSLEELLDIEIITASKRAEKVQHAPATIYVITEADILTYGYQDLQEALKGIPSVYLYNPHSWVWGGQRGFVSNFSQTLLMLNGREVNNLIALEGFISKQFATHNIKQIEILASPGSALYGANALAGIVNIITKDASADYEGVEIGFDFGSFNTKALNIVFGKKVNKDLKISGSTRLYSSDEEDFSDWVSNIDEFLPGWADKDYAKSYENFGAYRNFSQGIPVNLRTDYKGMHAGVNFYYNKQSHGLEQPKWDLTDNEDNRRFEIWYGGIDKKLRENLNLKADYSLTRSWLWGRYYSALWPIARLQNPSFIDFFQFDEWIPNKGDRAGHTFRMKKYDREKAVILDVTTSEDLILQEYYSSFADYLIDQGLIDGNRITTDDVHKYFTHIYTNKNSRGSLRDKFDFQLDYSPEEGHNITAGYTYDNINYVGLVVTDAGKGLGATYDIPVDLSKRNPVYDARKHGIFVQYQGKMIEDQLWLTIGGRWDNQNHYGSTLNLRSGLVYKPLKSSTFKLLYGEAFREPNAFEQAGNPGIKPAKLRSLEIVYSQDVQDIIRNDIILYFSKVTNFLGSVGSLIGSGVTSIDKQTTNGIEDVLKFKKKNLNGMIAFAYLFKAQVISKDDVEKEGDVLGIPDLKLSLGLSYAISNNLRVGVLNHFVNKYEAIGGSSGNVITIDSYNDLSLTFSIHKFQLFDAETNVDFYFTVKNVLNQKFYHANIRRSGTEKFLQNGRMVLSRLTFHL